MANVYPADDVAASEMAIFTKLVEKTIRSPGFEEWIRVIEANVKRAVEAETQRCAAYVRQYRRDKGFLAGDIMADEILKSAGLEDDAQGGQ